MNEYIQSALAIVGCIFDIFSIHIYFSACMGKGNIRVQKSVYFIFFSVFFAVDLILSQFGFAAPINIAKSFILFFCLTLLYETKWITRLFTALSILVAAMISELFGYGIAVASIKNTSAGELEFYSLMLSKMFTFAIALTVSVILKRNDRSVRFRDYLCLIITPMISFATIILISLELDTGEPKATAGICLAAAGILAINIVTFFLLENIIESNSIREKQSRMEHQFAFQEQKYEQTSQSFRSIRGIIHDTNKHLIYLDECISQGEYDEAKKYIGETIEHFRKSYKHINTGYLPVDALVSNTLELAKANSIDFKSDIKIEKERIKIERYDLCVALGNLLDNAVEAARKVVNPDDRFISVSIVTSENALVINIENSGGKRTDFKSDKKDTLLHGCGLGNVRAIAEKYSGVFTVDQNESRCEATLILPI